MSLEDIHKEALAKLKSYHVASIMPALRACNSGAIEDVLNTNGCAYYQYTPGLLEILQPKQIVELGGAMGVWDLMVLNAKYQDFKLYSITLEEGGLEFAYVVDKYPNFIPIVGDDLNLSLWPNDLDLKKTDLWFIDSEHTPEQLTKELDLYSPFFKKGSIVLFDDIHSFGLDAVWDEVMKGKWGKWEYLDITDPCHYSGYGMVRV